MKTKILIDFDGTIFNTEAFKEMLFNLFKGLGFAESEILVAYREECSKYHFSLENIMAALEKIRPYDKAEADKKIGKMFKRVPELIFDDLRPFLNKIDRERYEVDILTLGDINFQTRKVESSGLNTVFDNVFYTETQKWESLRKLVASDERFVLVDDRADTIYRVGQVYKNSIALQINRKDKDIDDPVLKTKDYLNKEIKSFNQVFEYLED